MFDSCTSLATRCSLLKELIFVGKGGGVAYWNPCCGMHVLSLARSTVQSYVIQTEGLEVYDDVKHLIRGPKERIYTYARIAYPTGHYLCYKSLKTHELTFP